MWGAESCDQGGQLPESPDSFLEDAAKRTSGDEVTISIRDFIAKWGAKRRGYWVIADIVADLGRFGLRSDPPFADGWIDNTIRLLPPKKTKSGDVLPTQ